MKTRTTTITHLYLFSITYCVAFASSLGNAFITASSLASSSSIVTVDHHRSKKSSLQFNNNNNNNKQRLDPLNFVGRAMRESSVVEGPSSSSSSSSSRLHNNVPAFVYTLNSSTKWIVTLAHTIAVWSQRNFIAPYIVVGSIGAVYFTHWIKQIINQSRPSHAPIADPGMPSSHSLVTFFAAVAWISTTTTATAATTTTVSPFLLVGSASTVAILRVVCGYHSVAQIVVGAGVGSFLGKYWVWFGETIVYASHPQLAYWFAWSAYLSGSCFFVGTNIRHWFTKDAHH